MWSELLVKGVLLKKKSKNDLFKQFLVSRYSLK